VSSACTNILGGSSPGTPSPARAGSELITFDFTSPGKAVAVGAPSGTVTQVALGNYLANVQATPANDTFP
jgi:hypothetical protein